MIIETPQDVTEAVLGEMFRTPDPRTKEVLSCLVKHLHAFVRETKLTEKEFQDAIGYVNAIGQRTTPSHNEAMLLSGALGVSNLVCLLNNGAKGTRPTQANNLGPFYRAGAPHLEVDAWHSSPVGLYENQDKTQAEMNLRGRFTTLADGSFSFRSVKPAGYPVPTEGPTGALLRAQKRHNMRPAHLHFLIHKPGCKTIASQVYDPEDPHLETDSQFGVTRALIGNFQKRKDGYELAFTFQREPGEARLPNAPITEKVSA